VYRFFSKIRIPHPHIRHLIHPRSIYELENPPERELKNHIIIFGAHRMGQRVAEYLQHRGEKFIVIERDPEIVRNLGRKGIYCIYGDAENDEILKKSSLDKAKLLILTIPFADTASFVVRKAKRVDGRIKILARAHSEIDAERLYKAGADVVIIPQFVSAEKIIKKIDHFLREREL
jgi:Trk K+ transport system NAD-binding subunit